MNSIKLLSSIVVVLLGVSCGEKPSSQEVSDQSKPEPPVQASVPVDDTPLASDVQPSEPVEETPIAPDVPALPAISAGDVGRQFLLAMLHNDADTLNELCIPAEGMENLLSENQLPPAILLQAEEHIKAFEFQQTYPVANRSDISLLSSDN